jgi:hypothetical protein
MKKKVERYLFDLAYPEIQSSDVISAESPDFICHARGEPVLGVEITELFRNEGYARLKKIPGYALQLIDSRAYKHKHDKKWISVENIQFKNPDGTLGKEIQGIFDPGITAHEAVSYLNSLIVKKSNKVSDYLRLTPEVDLVVHAASNIFSTEKQPIYRALSLLLDRSIIQSRFREIVLLISMHDKPTIKIPLKLALFVEDAFIFEKLIREDMTLKKLKPHEKFYLLFYCLQEKGYGSLQSCIESGRISIFVGAHEYAYTPSGKYINQMRFDHDKNEQTYKAISDRIADRNERLLEVGKRHLEERNKISCFVDVFTNCSTSNHPVHSVQPECGA